MNDVDVTIGKKMRPGTVVRYTPDPTRFEPHWCREGTAIANKHGRLVDTYWGTGCMDSHVVTDAEVATAEVLFHLDDYRELNDRRERATWEEYHPDDRQCVTSQHGLQCRLFVRHGAKPSHATKVENAREAVRKAEREVRSAELTLEWKRQELAQLEAQADAR